MRLHSNGYVEALLYIFIPLFVHVVLTPRLLVRTLRKMKNFALGDPDKEFVVREITSTMHITTLDQNVSASEEKNYMLQRAIAFHVANKLKLEKTRVDSVYQLTDKPLDAKDLVNKVLDEEKPKEDDFQRYLPRFARQYSKTPYSYEQLLQLQVSAAPTDGTWVEVEPGVFFQYTVSGYGLKIDEEPPQDSEMRRIATTYRFRSKQSDASDAIDKFVQDAFLSYQKRQLLAIARDTNRYMFVQIVQEKRAPPSSEPTPEGKLLEVVVSTTKEVVFKRYPLGDDRTFQNLFFEQKSRVLHLLDNFSQRRGKFAVKGFPYKLGLLLHGPPGTGKTSLIKAVAQYTRRHIVTVSLAKIKTNQELMNAIFDLRFPIEGRETPIVLDYKDVVFVMEDIDCAGASVVHARTSEVDSSEGQSRYRTTVTTEDSDKLNLSGLLNVLDGVIDCPGRILIMTTNHPEKLDPALIRPGRVNAQIFLGTMATEDVERMLEHYFRVRLTPEQRKKIAVKMEIGPMTPAEVEELCAEFDAVEDAIRALNAEKM